MSFVTNRQWRRHTSGRRVRRRPISNQRLSEQKVNFVDTETSWGNFFIINLYPERDQTELRLILRETCTFQDDLVVSQTPGHHSPVRSRISSVFSNPIFLLTKNLESLVRGDFIHTYTYVLIKTCLYTNHWNPYPKWNDESKKQRHISFTSYDERRRLIRPRNI